MIRRCPCENAQVSSLAFIAGVAAASVLLLYEMLLKLAVDLLLL